MQVKRYDKLVRDGIPAIIEATGAIPETRVLSEEEYLRRLDDKLGEELAEYIACGPDREAAAEELADLLEVIYAAAAARGVSPEALDALRARKRGARGGFEERLLLLSVTEP